MGDGRRHHLAVIIGNRRSSVVEGMQFDGIDVEEDFTEPSANKREERNADLLLPSIGDAVIVVEILRPIPIPQHLPSKRKDFGMLFIRGRRSHELSRMQKLLLRRLMMPMLTINQMRWKPHRCSLQSDNHSSSA